MRLDAQHRHHRRPTTATSPRVDGQWICLPPCRLQSIQNPLEKQPSYTFGHSSLAPPPSLACSAGLNNTTLPTFDESGFCSNSTFSAPSFGHLSSFGSAHDNLSALPPANCSHGGEKRKAPLGEKAAGGGVLPLVSSKHTKLPRQADQANRERDVLGGVSTHPHREVNTPMPIQPPTQAVPVLVPVSTHSQSAIFDLNWALTGTVMLEDDSHISSPTAAASDDTRLIEI